MASGYHKGKFFLFCFVVAFSFLQICWVFADPKLDSSVDKNYESISDDLDVLNRQQLQIEKLEGLVRDLSELVARFESRLSDHRYPDVKSSDSAKPSVGVSSKDDLGEKGVVGSDSISEKTRESDDLQSDSVSERTRDRVGAVSVTKYSPFWSERFQFVSAVRLESDATCVNVLPFKDFDGLSKYVAVGDDKGRVFIVSRNGDVLIEFETSSDARITALASFLTIYKNESFVLTGHENGVVIKHRVWEVAQNGEEWPSLHMETVSKFDSQENNEPKSSITSLEVHHMGRNRFVLSTDLSGNLRVFRENGSVYGLAVPKSRPLAFLKQRLLFLTETGAGSLDLRTMKIRESECEGLNNSIAKTYVFDAIEWSKAYGFTSEGDMIHVLLLGDIMNFKCRVRSKKKLETGMNEPLAFQAIKGYLLISNVERVWVYNVSSQHYIRAGGPKLVFSAGLDQIMTSFLDHRSVDSSHQKTMLVPILGSDREKLVILGTGSGYIGLYRSNLPVFKNEFNTMLWTSPVLLFILFLIGAWQFFANKKDALTSWGPDDPFSSTSVTDGAGKGEIAFGDSSRNTDIMDLRNSGLRGSSGRYGSSAPYRPGASETTSSRPSSVDPNFRGAPELKYRGPSLENAGFAKRRDGLYVNSQAVDDSS